MKIFKWNELTQEQKIDVNRATSIFLITFCIAISFYSLGMTFNQGILLLASPIVFVTGIVIARKFIKKAGGAKKVFADIPKQMDERLKKSEAKKEKVPTQVRIPPEEEKVERRFLTEEPERTEILKLEKEPVEEQSEKEKRIREEMED